jgi:tRNA(His) 5'-end guanylyltransferase
LITQGKTIMVQFVTKHKVIEALNLSDVTIKKYRRKGEWIEGIHWVRINSRCVRYNLDLIQDWMHNRHNPEAHLRAIIAYQRTLLSHQKQYPKPRI